MQKYSPRILAALLVPCLIADPAFASLRQVPVVPFASSVNGVYAEQALVPCLTTPFFGFMRSPLSHQIAELEGRSANTGRHLFRRSIAASLILSTFLTLGVHARGAIPRSESVIVHSASRVMAFAQGLAQTGVNAQTFQSQIAGLFDPLQRSNAAMSLLAITQNSRDYQRALLAVVMKERDRQNAAVVQARLIGRNDAAAQAEAFSQLLSQLLISVLQQPGSVASLLDLSKSDIDHTVGDRAIEQLSAMAQAGASLRDLRPDQIDPFLRALIRREALTPSVMAVLQNIATDPSQSLGLDVASLFKAMLLSELYGDTLVAGSLRTMLPMVASTDTLLDSLGESADRMRGYTRYLGALVDLIPNALGLDEIELGGSGAKFLMEAIRYPQSRDTALFVLQRAQVPGFDEQSSLAGFLMQQIDIERALGANAQQLAPLSSTLDNLLAKSDESLVLLELLTSANFPPHRREIVLRLAANRQGRLFANPLTLGQVQVLMDALEDPLSRPAARNILAQVAIPNTADQRQKLAQALADYTPALDTVNRDLRQTLRTILLKHVESEDLEAEINTLPPAIRAEILKRWGDDGKIGQFIVEEIESAGSAQARRSLIEWLGNQLQISSELTLTPTLAVYVIQSLDDPLLRSTAARILTGSEIADGGLNRLLAIALLKARLAGPVFVDTQAIRTHLDRVVQNDPDRNEERALLTVLNDRESPFENPAIKIEALKRFAQGRNIGAPAYNTSFFTSLRELFPKLDMSDADADQILAGVPDAATRQALVLDRTISQNRRLVRSNPTRNLWDVLLNRHVDLEDLVSILADASVGYEVQHEALELLAGGPNVRYDLQRNLEALKYLAQALNRPGDRELAKNILSKITEPETVRISREMILLEAPAQAADVWGPARLEPILVEVLGSAQHIRVTQAAIDLLVRSPAIDRAVLTPSAAATLVAAVDREELRAAALQILGTAGFDNRSTQQSALEVLLSKTLVAGLTGDVALSIALNDFMMQILGLPDGPDLLRDISRETFDESVRKAAAEWLTRPRRAHLQLPHRGFLGRPLRTQLAVVAAAAITQGLSVYSILHSGSAYTSQDLGLPGWTAVLIAVPVAGTIVKWTHRFVSTRFGAAASLPVSPPPATPLRQIRHSFRAAA